MKEKKQNLLILSYYFPPIKSIGTLRNYQIYKQGQKHFNSVKVITTQNRNILQQEPFPVKDQDVHLSPTFDYRTFFRYLRGKSQTHFSETVKTRRVQLLIKLIQSFPLNLILGEGGVLYILCGFFTGLRLIRRHRITHLYSSYMPYADHAVAWLLKLCYPNLYWIADFRDLHIDPIRQHTLWNGLQRKFNKKILRKADVVTTVSQGLAEQLQHFHPKVYVLPNSIAPVLLQKETPAPKVNSKKFTITYTGSIYHNLQDPGLFIQALGNLITKGKLKPQQVQLVYAGKDSMIWGHWIQQAGLDHIFEDHGLISWSAAIQLQRQSHLNLLLSWSEPNSSGILTGKLAEYLAARRPVIALIKGTYDEEFETILGSFQAGKVFYTGHSQVEALEKEILQHFQQWLRKGDVRSAISEEKLAKYGWERQFDHLVAFIREEDQALAAEEVLQGTGMQKYSP